MTAIAFPITTNKQFSLSRARMQETAETDEYDRRVIHREWRNTDGELHRTTGPALEECTVLPDGARMLSFQAWYLNGSLHREGRPSFRQWAVAVDGIRTLVHEGWYQHGRRHRVGGPSYRCWTVQRDGIRTLSFVWWRVNGKLHRVAGPAYAGHEFYWQNRGVSREDLPWLRRGHGVLAAFTRASRQQGVCGGVISPAWARDARVMLTGANVPTEATYRSAVGGSVLLCV